MGPEEKQFNDSVRRYVNGFEPPAHKRTALEWVLTYLTHHKDLRSF